MNRVMAFLRKAPAVLPVEKMAPVPVVNAGGGRRKSGRMNSKKWRSKKASVFSRSKKWRLKKERRKAAERSRRVNRRRK